MAVGVYVNLPIGLAALAGLRLRMPAPRAEAARHPLDVLGAALLAAATAGFILICVWGGRRYPWGAPEVLALAGLTGALVLALVLRERRAADPIVPFELLRTGTMAIACSVLFLTTAALFAVNVFVPLYLQTTTGATPTEAGLLLVPMMLGITVSTNLAGRGIARTGRYKRYPVAGAAMMTLALIELAAVAGSPSRLTIGIGLAIFGLGFGMVGQVLIVAVQNAVDRGRLGVAMAATSFSRGLGGAVGAALLGAVFASRVAGSTAPAAARGDLIDGVQTVFIAAAPLAALALAAVLPMEELPLFGREPTTQPPETKGPTWQTATDATTATGGRATAASAPETAIARPSRPSSANSI